MRLSTRFPSRRRPLSALVVGAVILSLAAVVGAAWSAAPSVGDLQAKVRLSLRGTGGQPVSLSAIAPILREAVVATEDERFYTDDGIDLIGVMRAVPYDVTHLSLAEGASTITEQVAKGLYLDGNDHNPWRKLEDAALALELEAHYSKEQILAAYLNSSYFGAGGYGAWLASRRYFGVTPAQLTTAQASLLAGLLQSPSGYDPFVHPQLARARQIDVLRSLVRNGFLTDRQAAATLAHPLRLEGGKTLPPIRGVDFAPGPAFVWWQLGLGAAVAFLGLAALITTRLPRLRIAHGIVALRIASLVLFLVGISAVFRSFRTA